MQSKKNIFLLLIVMMVLSSKSYANPLCQKFFNNKEFFLFSAEELQRAVLENVKQLLKHPIDGQKITQAMLADHLQVTPSAVSHLLSGRTALSLTHLYKIALLYKINMADLIPDPPLNLPKTSGLLSLQNLQRIADLVQKKFGRLLTSDNYIDLIIDATIPLGNRDNVTLEEAEEALKRVLNEKLASSSTLPD